MDSQRELPGTQASMPCTKPNQAFSPASPASPPEPSVSWERRFAESIAFGPDNREWNSCTPNLRRPNVWSAEAMLQLFPPRQCLDHCAGIFGDRRGVASTCKGGDVVTALQRVGFRKSGFLVLPHKPSGPNTISVQTSRNNIPSPRSSSFPSVLYGDGVREILCHMRR